MKRIPRKLDPVDCRVLGALLEKEQATPEYYPLTLKALTAACNQKSNREPVMVVTEEEVEESLHRLFQDVFVWKAEGARVARFRHGVDRRWGLTPATKAVMTLLLLRGPQTTGELKSRSDRLHRFASPAEVEAALAELATGEEPLVEKLPRQPGQKEGRWRHRVGEEGEIPAAEPEPWTPGLAAAVPGAQRTVITKAEGGGGLGSPSAEVAADAGGGLAGRLTRLEERVAELAAALAALKESLGEE